MSRQTDISYLKHKKSAFSRFLFLQRMRLALKLLKPFGGEMTLEIGAANCDSARFLRQYFTVVAVDRSIELLQAGPRDLMKVCADARMLPFKSGTFDAVIVISTFKHIFRPHLAAAESARVLRPGGTLIIIEPLKWIVKGAGRLGYFDMKNIANLWGARETAVRFTDWGFRTVDFGSRWCFQFVVTTRCDDLPTEGRLETSTHG